MAASGDCPAKTTGSAAAALACDVSSGTRKTERVERIIELFGSGIHLSCWSNRLAARPDDRRILDVDLHFDRAADATNAENLSV